VVAKLCHRHGKIAFNSNDHMTRVAPAHAGGTMLWGRGPLTDVQTWQMNVRVVHKRSSSVVTNRTMGRSKRTGNTRAFKPWVSDKKSDLTLK